MIHKFLAHTDARILDMKLVIGIARQSAAPFRNPQAYNSASLRVFYGIAKKVKEHLIQPQLIADNLLVLYIHGVNIKLKPLGMNVRLKNTAKPVEYIG